MIVINIGDLKSKEEDAEEMIGVPLADLLKMFSGYLETSQEALDIVIQQGTPFMRKIAENQIEHFSRQIKLIRAEMERTK